MRCLVILTGCMFLAVTACKAPQPASTPQPESAAPEPAAPEPPALRVGAASGTVNPSEGVFLGGYGYGRRCTGVHDNLYAKAVVFDDGKTPLALVVVDALSLQYATVQAIREAASKRTGDLAIPPERIIAQATHSHCAPDTIGIYGADPATSGVDPAYLEQLAIVTAIQVERAVAALRPARLVWAEAECVGWAVNDSEPDVLDNSVTVIQCLDGSGANIATLTNFACHPTVLDEDTTLAGADWVGAFYKAMARALPGEHLFLQGAIGAWIQPLTPERTFELADRYGRDLAEKTLAALRTSRSLEGTAIRFAREVFDMPLHNELLRQMIE
ncbi:MAG TPA: neutral/alkaline non-lysosomal ceramidase N-terminal domain-containing protein, partial [Candidatus Hydrogenedentes bacterium]|nr:neutral/alkaline non-lysosomal ceramidase N-terminal domain-containing protein [Candidatus Hydrogenedentota bacterium]